MNPGRPALLRDLPGALALLAAGVLLGLAANGVNPRGLPLDWRPPPPPRTGLAREDVPLYGGLAPEEIVTLAEAYRLFRDGRVFFVDARPSEEFRRRRIAGLCYNVPADAPEKALARVVPLLTAPVPSPDRPAFPHGYPVVVYCGNRSCDMAAQVLRKLRAAGVRTARCLVAGLDAWMRRGYPVVVPEGGREVLRRGGEIPRLGATWFPWLPPGAQLAVLVALTAFLALAWRRRLPPRVRAAAGLVAALALAALFLVAAFFKLRAPEAFARMVLCYDLLPLPGLPVFAVTLPAVEATAALALLPRRTRPAAVLLLGALLVAFVGALFSLLVRDLDCACGCFPGEFRTSWVRVYEDLLFLLLAALAYRPAGWTGP